VRIGAAVALSTALACAPALQSGRSPAPPGGPGSSSEPGSRSRDELLRDGHALWARRPDADAVRQATSTFLAAARADPGPATEALYGAIVGELWLARHRPRREQAGHAEAAVRLGQECEQRAPAAGECAYGLALALGLQARDRLATAHDGLRLMVERLKAAAARAPDLDGAGPARVLALVYLRAPAWPVGPGDPDAGLEQARAAAARAPEHPANRLVLGEALFAAGDERGGREAAAAGLAAAEARVAAGDPDAAEWVVEGRRLLAAADAGL
jgi:hypothetical protein